MNNTILPVCLPSSHSYDIVDDLHVKVTVVKNPYQLPLASLFLMAARKNKKRGFLFVSKILGKHIPVHPLIPLLGGGALAGRYASVMYQDKSFEEHCNMAQSFANASVREKTWQYMRQHPIALPEKTLFIGFAETATALGQSMFSCFADNAYYIHTTREELVDATHVLHFVEEHSHATEHYCYGSGVAIFDNDNMVVLVDDEITTGKSALNFIRAIQGQYPRKQYAVVSILDWRSDANRQSFTSLEKELGITIHCISLLSGTIMVEGEPSTEEDIKHPAQVHCMVPHVEEIQIQQQCGALLDFSSRDRRLVVNTAPYLYATGRFGIASKELAELESTFEQIAHTLRNKRQGTKTLCLGTGEFMHIPFKIASYMGEGVVVQSTTQSPIYPREQIDYGAQNAITFTSPYDDMIDHYLYNIPAQQYDEVFIFLERSVHHNALDSLLGALATLEIPHIHIVIFASKGKE